MSESKTFEASTFWREETDKTELLWRGHVFTASSHEAARELMTHLNGVEAMADDVKELALRHSQTSHRHEDDLVRAFRHLDKGPKP